MEPLRREAIAALPIFSGLSAEGLRTLLGASVIQKAARGYSLFRADDGQPVARLRPTGTGDQVEVMWWSHRDRWDQIGDFGPMLMSMDEALHYVATDPLGCFWH